ncbi:hypothetical protein EJB05_05742, partial [Eragrostis curvula]
MPSASGRRSKSASAIVADKERGRHELSVDASSLTAAAPTGAGGLLTSCPFTVGGHRWRIRYFPNGADADSAGYVSLFLALDEDVAKPVTAEIRLRVLFLAAEVGGAFTIRCDVSVLNGFRVEAAAPRDRIPPSDLHKHLGDLLQSGRGADVVFEVGGERFAAHRCVLGARSPVISAELLTGSDAAANTDAGVVRVDGVEPRAFKVLLQYAYTDMLPPETDKDEEDSMLRNLIVAADRYGLERLKLICEDKLCQSIDVGTVEAKLGLAERHHCHALKEACLDFLSTPANLRAVMAARV